MNRKPYTGKRQSQILTVPNLLSLFRIALIPLFVWLYHVQEDSVGTALTLLLSGVTDIADGLIARRFHMTSDLGKVLDPVADKLTLAAMLICLLARFPWMGLPLGVMVLKELFMGVTGFLIIQKTGNVLGANWHGKMATVLLYSTSVLHVLWRDIPAVPSGAAICACTVALSVSFALYGIRNMKILKAARSQ